MLEEQVSSYKQTFLKLFLEESVFTVSFTVLNMSTASDLIVGKDVENQTTS